MLDRDRFPLCATLRTTYTNKKIIYQTFIPVYEVLETIFHYQDDIYQFHDYFYKEDTVFLPVFFNNEEDRNLALLNLQNFDFDVGIYPIESLYEKEANKK